MKFGTLKASKGSEKEMGKEGITMRKARYSLGLALLVVASLYLLPPSGPRISQW
jgi:hypothetical protein